MAMFDEETIMEDFYYMLWKKQDEVLKNPFINVPDTIIYKEGEITQWYFTSLNGYMLKKNRESFMPTVIEEIFTECGGNEIVVAVFIKKSSEQSILQDPDIGKKSPQKLIIDYLNCEQLKELLYRKQRYNINGVLQRFISPRGVRNDAIISTWSPSLCVIERLENNKLLHDVRYGVYERLVTFEGPEFYTSPKPVQGVSAVQYLKDLSTKIADHITVNFNTNILSNSADEDLKHQLAAMRPQIRKLNSMVLHFKTDKDGKVWFLYCTSASYQDTVGVQYQCRLRPSTGTKSIVDVAKQHPNYALSRQSLSTPISPIARPKTSESYINDTGFSDSVNTTLTNGFQLPNTVNLYPMKRYTKIQPLVKKNCLSCNVPTIEIKQYGVTYKSVVNHFEHVMKLAAKDEGVAEPQLPYWPINQNIIDAAGGIGFGCQESVNEQIIHSSMDGNEEFYISPVIRYQHPMLKLSRYLKECKNDALFLANKANVCEKCYLAYAKFTTMFLSLGSKRIETLNEPFMNPFVDKSIQEYVEKKAKTRAAVTAAVAYLERASTTSTYRTSIASNRILHGGETVTGNYNDDGTGVGGYAFVGTFSPGNIISPSEGRVNTAASSHRAWTASSPTAAGSSGRPLYFDEAGKGQEPSMPDSVNRVSTATGKFKFYEQFGRNSLNSINEADDGLSDRNEFSNYDDTTKSHHGSLLQKNEKDYMKRLSSADNTLFELDEHPLQSMIATKKKMDLINQKQVFSTTNDKYDTQYKNKIDSDEKLYGKRAMTASNVISGSHRESNRYDKKTNSLDINTESTDRKSNSLAHTISDLRSTASSTNTAKSPFLKMQSYVDPNGKLVTPPIPKAYRKLLKAATPKGDSSYKSFRKSSTGGSSSLKYFDEKDDNGKFTFDCSGSFDTFSSSNCMTAERGITTANGTFRPSTTILRSSWQQSISKSATAKETPESQAHRQFLDDMLDQLNVELEKTLSSTAIYNATLNNTTRSKHNRSFQQTHSTSQKKLASTIGNMDAATISPVEHTKLAKLTQVSSTNGKRDPIPQSQFVTLRTEISKEMVLPQEETNKASPELNNQISKQLFSNNDNEDEMKIIADVADDDDDDDDEEEIKQLKTLFSYSSAVRGDDHIVGVAKVETADPIDRIVLKKNHCLLSVEDVSDMATEVISKVTTNAVAKLPSKSNLSNQCQVYGTEYSNKNEESDSAALLNAENNNSTNTIEQYFEKAVTINSEKQQSISDDGGGEINIFDDTLGFGSSLAASGSVGSDNEFFELVKNVGKSKPAVEKEVSIASQPDMTYDIKESERQ